MSHVFRLGVVKLSFVKRLYLKTTTLNFAVPFPLTLFRLFLLVCMIRVQQHEGFLAA